LAKVYDEFQFVIDLGERSFAFNAEISDFDDGAVRLTTGQAETLMSRMAEALKVSYFIGCEPQED
jgi:hypothetical protein